MEESSILLDLTNVLVSASAVSIIFSLLRWPAILGYLLAGMLAGPYITPELWVKNQDKIREISELGVIFLMFYIGLEFDLRKLKQTFFPAFLAMILQTFFAFFLGTSIAPLLGIPAHQGIFLGAIFAISSTMVAIPILKNKGELRSSHAQFAIGISIFEDILAIILLVLLASKTQKAISWSVSLDIIFLITVFIAGTFFFGRLIANKVLAVLQKVANEEVIHLAVVAFILLSSRLASGFSTALGAFVAGSIFSSTKLVNHLEKMVAPIRDVFSAVFFVSIGMLIDPKLIWSQKYTILALSILVVFGKILTVWLGLFLAGQKSYTAFLASVPKAQIGEFSFVIAALAKSLGLADGGLMALTAGVSLFSIILANILSSKEMAVFNVIEKIFPRGIKNFGEIYHNFLFSIQSHISGNLFWSLVKKPLSKIVVHFFLINAIIWCNSFLCSHIVEYNLPYTIWIQRSLSISALILSLPFMICIIKNINIAVLSIIKSSLRGLFQRLMHHSALYQILQLIIVTFAVSLLTWIFLIASSRFLPPYMPLLVFVILGLVLAIAFGKHFLKINSQIEWMFLESFKTELESDRERRKKAMIKMVSKKHPWNAEIQTVIVNENSSIVGKRIFETNIRAKTGATVIGISRGGYLSYETGPDTMLFPNDSIVLLGSQNQLNKANAYINEIIKEQDDNVDSCIDFGQIIIPNNSSIANETLASANIRKLYGVNVVGIQRNDVRIDSLNPEDMIKGGDVLLVIGKSNNISNMQSAISA